MNGETRYIGRRLGVILREQGRQQQWLAQRVGVSKSFMSYMVAGQRTVGADVAERIAAVLGVPLFLAFDLHCRSDSMTREEQAA